MNLMNAGSDTGESSAAPAQPAAACGLDSSKRFTRPMRLSGRLAFAAVYDGGRGRSRGPLKIISLPNTLGHARLGLSVSRRVGTAPARNRIKRLLRESFRLLDPAARGSYDFIIVVRPHAPLKLADYQMILADLFARADGQSTTQRGKAGDKVGVISDGNSNIL